ncbi:hypothetical protein ACFX15_027816 [Malus domestica]
MEIEALPVDRRQHIESNSRYLKSEKDRAEGGLHNDMHHTIDWSSGKECDGEKARCATRRRQGGLEKETEKACFTIVIPFPRSSTRVQISGRESPWQICK